jgi:ribulose-5-phosphate 4-epimerase/fuculose-1-phosphate aldolase
MYDILGGEKHGDQDAGGEKESSSTRLHNDVHKVRKTCFACSCCRGIVRRTVLNFCY